MLCPTRNNAGNYHGIEPGCCLKADRRLAEDGERNHNERMTMKARENRQKIVTRLMPTMSTVTTTIVVDMCEDLTTRPTKACSQGAEGGAQLGSARTARQAMIDDVNFAMTRNRFTPFEVK